MSGTGENQINMGLAHDKNERQRKRARWSVDRAEETCSLRGEKEAGLLLTECTRK